MNCNTLASDLSTSLCTKAHTLKQDGKAEAKHIADPLRARFIPRPHSDDGIMVGIYALIGVSLLADITVIALLTVK